MNKREVRVAIATLIATFVIFGMAVAEAQDPWVVYEGADGPGKGKHVVLISGDEEYRSEETLPQLGKILATRHGFTCTVLFAIHPENGYIDPNQTGNIPGLESLESADLMVIFTRFRALPNEQMRYIDAYLKSGKPVIGIRTSTHAFKFDAGSPWERYSNGYAGKPVEWTDGFGRLVLGEMWINHHGKHKYESTSGVIAPDAKDHPIVRGIKDGDVWGPTDVYGVRLPLPGDSIPLVLGSVHEHGDVYDETDLHYGMRPETGKPVAGDKNNPMMPVAWAKSYQIPEGAKGKAFTTTIGASTDFQSPGVRRMLVNAAYWCVGIEGEIPEAGTNANIVGEFAPTKFEFRDNDYWAKRNMRVEEHQLKK
ncbi:MAG TPA: ThuA domain-containing protein [Candidatus Hydrogenedentes bacterium]|nr:ThuA domain-containing protein [Candidatus Hydrogenedentota bacterium]HRK34497.1 ThuA domain-containing protein [Candidatus Hydrogenedentota bacterium]